MNAFDALGNPVRRTLLDALREGPRSVGSLAADLPVSRPAVSRHLKVLEAAGLIRHAEQGRKNLYALRIEGFSDVQTYLDDLWGDALSRFRLVAENLEQR